MLHYAETARSRTTVPLLPVPGSHQPERNTERVSRTTCSRHWVCGPGAGPNESCCLRKENR